MNRVEQLDLERKRDRLIIDEPNNTKETSDPIIGYAQEPLLPLIDACEPLIPIVHDICKYTAYALEHTPDQPSDGLTRNESASIRLYTMEWNDSHPSLYSILNQTLKGADRNQLRPWFKYLKLFLTAVVKLPIARPQAVWRGVPKDISDQFQRGADVTWWSFSSTTTSLPVLENNLYLGKQNARTLISIEIFNGRSVRAHSHFNDEDEILLLPGTYLKVLSQFNPAPDLHVIHLKQSLPEQILLEPPFESILPYSLFFYSWKEKFIFRCTTLSKDKVKFSLFVFF